MKKSHFYGMDGVPLLLALVLSIPVVSLRAELDFLRSALEKESPQDGK